MRRYTTLAAVLCLVLTAGADDALDALARHRESLGVDALWESVESIRYSGTIASGGMEGTTDILVVLPAEKPIPRPDGGYDAGGFVGGIHYRSEISLGPLRELVLITPAGGWVANPAGGVRELDGIELADYTASMVFDSFLYLFPDPAFFSVTWAGREEVEGFLCDVLEFGPVAGGLPFHPRRYYLDSSDGSLRRITSELSVVLHETDCSEHRDFSGLRLPSRFRTVLYGLPLVIDQTLTEVVLDGPVDPALLLPPAAERLTFPAEGLVQVQVELVGGGVFVPI
ncbi:MAG TPA: hypothetical protein ENN88_03040, partial [Candidatus Coatesbacteria bacterium]|nr:hypothetical protein [Candidatus Coatesbacteria bacterium]